MVNVKAFSAVLTRSYLLNPTFTDFVFSAVKI